MRKCLQITLTAMALTFSGMAGAGGEDLYAGIQAGLNFAHDGEVDNSGADMTFHTGYAYGAFIGYDPSGWARLEAEVTYRGNHIQSEAGVPAGGTISSTALMANAFYDVKTRGSWGPYFGGGLGTARITLERGGTGKDWVMAYQIIGGVGFALSPKTMLAVDYRYFRANDPKFNTGATFKQEYSDSTVMIGIRAGF